MVRLLSVLGVSFVLLLVAGSIAGFAVLKDRVRIVVAADEVAAGPDPVALLRDDVAVLARDLGALQAAVAGNFEKLAQGLDGAAGARHGELQQETEALRRQLAALTTAQQSVPAKLQAMAEQLAAAVAAAGHARATTPPAPVVAVQQPDSVTPVAPPVVVPAEEQIPQPAAAKPAKASFLSFDVPKAKFLFDVAQDFVLVPELSRVGFDAKSTLHDFTGVTSQVSGSFRADFDDPEGAWTGSVAVQAATLVTGVDGRDAGLRDHLATKEHPTINFNVARFVPEPNGIDVAKRTARGTVHGTMTIRGVEKQVAMPITVTVDPQQRVVLNGQMPIKLSDYGVPVPSQLGVINMQDEVAVWIALRCRVRAGASK